jgi:hypothetical protein
MEQTTTPQKALSVTTTTTPEGRILVTATGEYGDIKLYFQPGPYVSIPNPDRPGYKLKACFGLDIGGKVTGFFVAKQGATGMTDRLVFIPEMRARKSVKRTPSKSKRGK